METKKEKLIAGLSLAISALKDNTIHYDWVEQDSCNCGVVAQAITGLSRPDLRKMWNEVSGALDGIKKDGKAINKTWQNGVKHLCPITGQPTVDIFKILFAQGLSKSDIVHLEYMDNPAILAKSGISTNNLQVKIKVKQPVPHSFPLFRWLKIKGKEVEVEAIENSSFFTNKGNLILYLTAWVQILKEGGKLEPMSNLSVTELQKELLIAIAEDNFEYACVLRDKINIR